MNETEKIKERHEIEEQYKWAIHDIYADDNAWNADYDFVKSCTDKIKAYKGKLGESAETLYSYFTMNDEISVKFDSLVNYAHRRHDEDTANPVYLEMSGRLSSLISDISDASSFEVPEILAISKETLEKFYK